MLATGIKTPVGIKLMGEDLQQLSEIGEQIEALLRPLPDVLSAYSERVTGGNFIDIDIDRIRAAREGFLVGDIQDVIKSAVGGMNVSWAVEGLERYPINVRYPRELRNNVKKLERLTITSPKGYAVPLGQVADIKIVKGPPMIKSENARRTAWIFVDLKTSDVGGFVKKAKELISNEVQIPDGVSVVWSGQFEYMERAAKRLKIVVPITLALIFLILFMNFKSITESLIMMITVPFALVGGIWLMYFAGYNFSVAVGVGFIALAGLAAENGVVLLVYLDEAFNRWKSAGKLNSLKDLKNPAMSLSLKGTVNLNEFKKIIPDSLVSDLGGFIKIDIQMSGSIKDFKKITAADMQRINAKAHLDLQKVRYQFPGRQTVFSDASGHIRLDETLLLDSVSLKINDNPLSFTGTFRNFWPYLDHKKGTLDINGSVNSTGFNLTDIFKKKPDDKKNSLNIHFPGAILASISLNTDELSYRKFYCQDFSGYLNYQSGKLSLNRVSFATMDGSANGKAIAFETKGKRILTRANVEFKNIDMKKLFHQMGNFRQTFIVEENLSGKAYGNVQYSSEWDTGLSLDPGSVIVNGHYVIENGKLVHFKPIESLSRFISLSELKNIKFSTLENDIYIQDKVIYIPSMAIQSSAFNINASGTHDFNNHFDYHLKVLLSEVLASKARKKKKQNQEFGISGAHVLHA
jgi:hypothetical protein